MEGITVAIKPRRSSISIPGVCPCCLAHSDSALELKYEWFDGRASHSSKLSVSACKACLAHREKASGLNWAAGILLGVGFLIMVLGVYSLHGEMVAGVGIALLVGGLLIQLLTSKSRIRKATRLMKPECTSLGIINLKRTRYGENKGAVLITVGNQTYASALLSGNDGAKILSKSDLRAYS